MMKRRNAILCLALLGTLAVPREADASLADLIWEMSGPQLLGLGAECEVGLSREPDPKCQFLSWPYRASWVDNRWFWLTVEARVYFSTGKNAEDDGVEFEFRFQRARMIGVDPMLAFGRVSPSGHTRVHSGIGVSLNRMFGPDIEDFNNYAFKLRPLSVEHIFRRVTLGAGYNLRIYPNGFNASGLPPGGLGLTSEAEVVHGASIELRF
jgi:hypothetical protein